MVSPYIPKALQWCFETHIYTHFDTTTLATTMATKYYPVIHFRDAKNNEKYVLVLSSTTAEEGGKDVEGIALTKIGLGCKDDNDTIAFPNTRDIPRVVMKTEKVVSFKAVVSDVEVLVVLEDVVKSNAFLAYADMSLSLMMINDQDCFTYAKSFTLKSGPSLFEDDPSYENRDNLFQHFNHLVRLRVALAKPLK